MKNTFYRVQNKSDVNDYVDFKTIDEARKFCAASSLNEETHQLEKWLPNRKSPKREVQLSFIMKEQRAVGMIVKATDDDSQLAVLGAMEGF